MSPHVTYDDITNTFTISTGRESLTGLSPAEYRQFIAEVRDGMYNAFTLMQHARARHMATAR